MPSPSTPTVTGDVWSPSPDRRVTSTAQWLRATNARASSGLTRPPWWSARLARLNPRSRLFGGHLDPQQPEGHLDGRTDPEGEQDGTDAGRATEQHADDQHAGLDDRHVDQRARPGPDAGQGPGDQQDHADEDGRDPEGQGRHVADAVMEHIPGPDSQPGAQAQDHAGGEQPEPGDELEPGHRAAGAPQDRSGPGRR